MESAAATIQKHRTAALDRPKADLTPVISNALRFDPDKAVCISDDDWAKQYNCVRCQDTGRDMKLYLETGNLKTCICKLERLRKERFQTAIKNTPKAFGWLTDGLNSVAPDANIHPKQPQILEYLTDTDQNGKPNDEKSYYFFGRTGAHKTTIALALMQEAGRRGQKTFYEVGRSLVDIIRTFQNTNEIVKNADGKQKEFYSLSQLESSERLCILIDEIEDTASSLTPFTMSILFGLFEKCQAYGHQLLITSNVSLDDLLNRWVIRDFDGRADAANYANKIYRRIGETCLDMDLT